MYVYTEIRMKIPKIWLNTGKTTSRNKKKEMYEYIDIVNIFFLH